MEAKALPGATKQAVMRFLHEEIFTRFRIPQERDIDGRNKFTSINIRDFMDIYKIKHRVTTPYHLSANGQVEGTN